MQAARAPTAGAQLCRLHGASMGLFVRLLLYDASFCQPRLQPRHGARFSTKQLAPLGLLLAAVVQMCTAVGWSGGQHHRLLHVTPGCCDTQGRGSTAGRLH